ncbi:50S ribosomal protein L13 [Candidatus Woesearchaeota archaeon]|jgi:large subunit ribosomal protein L13|nr:50S ribosomal protein L13 [Candidatus Woesearchaeota archaeon]MBT6044534.1 50S ribosomal protein L13 [Candidatus Woesearchaeota archaeon]
MILDGKNLIAGRLASFAAKQALFGNDIEIINSELVMITGSKSNVMAKQNERQARGHPYKGPFVPRREDLLLRRMIRGMLPYKQSRGMIAFKKVKCHLGIPDELKDKPTTEVKGANITKTQTLKYIRLAEVSKLIGRKK